jgi:hypothetical protein
VTRNDHNCLGQVPKNKYLGHDVAPNHKALQLVTNFSIMSNMDPSFVTKFTTRYCSHILPTWTIMTTFATTTE